MKIRRTQVVLIVFAVASWFGAVLELAAAVDSENRFEHDSVSIEEPT